MIPGIIAWRRQIDGSVLPIGNLWYLEKEFYGETSSSNFAESISMSPNKNYVAASHYKYTTVDTDYNGKVNLYKFENSNWIDYASILNPNHTTADPLAFRRFGAVVAISDQYLITTAFERDLSRNKVYVFLIDPMPGESVRFVTSFYSPDHSTNQNFGWSLSISGNKLAVGTASGSMSSGKVFIYDLAQTSATLAQTIIPSTLVSPDLENSKFGSTLKTLGDTLLVGAPSNTQTLSGVHIYKLVGGSYVENSIITSPVDSDRFGLSLDISEKYIAIGAPYTDSQFGKVYVYENISNNWTLISTIIIPGSTNNAGVGEAYTGVVLNGIVYFGRSVSLHGESLAIGANFDNGNSSINGGVVYLFERNQTTLEWVETTKILNPITTDAGYFGSQVINTGDTLFISAWANDHYVAGSISDVDKGTLHIYRKGTPTYNLDYLPSVITSRQSQVFSITQDTQSATVNTVRIPVTLIRNQAIRFGTTNMYGSSHTFDTYIRLRDSGLNTVAENDDHLNSEGNVPVINTAEVGVNWVNDTGSFIYYLAPASGVYYMDVGGFDVQIGDGTVVWEIIS